MGHEHPKGDPGDLIISLRLDADEGRRWEGDPDSRSSSHNY